MCSHYLLQSGNVTKKQDKLSKLLSYILISVQSGELVECLSYGSAMGTSDGRAARMVPTAAFISKQRLDDVQLGTSGSRTSTAADGPEADRHTMPLIAAYVTGSLS